MPGQRPASGPVGGDSERKRWGILLLLALFHTLDSFVRLGMAPLGPLIMRDLGIGRGALGVLTSAIRLSGISVAVGAGKLVDIIGVRKAMIVVAIAVPTVLSLFLIPLTYWTAFALFFLVGASISLVSPLGNAAIMHWFPVRERGLAFGVKQMGVPFGAAVTGLILPAVALRFGWQNAFVGLGLAVGFAAFVMAAIYRSPGEPFRRARNPQPKETDAAAESPEPANDPDDAAQPDDERSTAWEVLTGPGMPWLIMMGFSFAAVQMCFLTFATPFLEDIGYDVVTAGAYLSLSQVAGMAGRPLVGVISDRFMAGERKRMLLSLAIIVVGSVGFMASSAATLGPFALAVTFVVVGGATMAWAGLFFAAVLERSDPRSLGSASGLASTANMSGSLLGAPIFGFIADATSFTLAYWSFGVWLAGVATLFYRFFDEGSSAHRSR